MKKFKLLTIAALIPLTFGLTGCNGGGDDESGVISGGSDSSTIVKPDVKPIPDVKPDAGSDEDEVVVVNPGETGVDGVDNAMACFNPGLYVEGNHSASWETRSVFVGNNINDESFTENMTYTNVVVDDESLLKQEKVTEYEGGYKDYEASYYKFNHESGEMLLVKTEVGNIDADKGKVIASTETYSPALIETKFDLVKGKVLSQKGQLTETSSYGDKEVSSFDSTTKFAGFATLSVGGSTYNTCKFVEKASQSFTAPDGSVTTSTVDIEKYWAKDNGALLLVKTMFSGDDDNGIESETMTAASLKINGVEQL